MYHSDVYTKYIVIVVKEPEQVYKQLLYRIFDYKINSKLTYMYIYINLKAVKMQTRTN